MGQSYQSGNTAITGAVSVTSVSSIPQPSANQTPISIYLAGSGASQDVYTVPAGKVFYLTSVIVTSNVAGAIAIFLNDGATFVLNAYNLINDAKTYNPISPIGVYTATQKVKATNTNLLGVNYYGILVDA